MISSLVSSVLFPCFTLWLVWTFTLWPLWLVPPLLLYCLELSPYSHNSNHFFHILLQWRMRKLKAEYACFIRRFRRHPTALASKVLKYKDIHLTDHWGEDLFFCFRSFWLNLLAQEEKKLVVSHPGVDLWFGFTMASCRAWNIRVLVAVVCGLLTGIILGLGIWRIVIRIQRGNVVLLCLTQSKRRHGTSVPATWGTSTGRCLVQSEASQQDAIYGI